MCCLPELEQFAAMDDMADWGVTHLKESAIPESEPEKVEEGEAQ